ncbi:response regulator transcription factor [Nesterenkonia natronophila]|uniref:Response regulator n=1 Tax=Nesterenkonia natronophila TaxID=2174932 RepID=A0A3A4FBB0_9MICC|nr:response regulator transcription factor [Nesterenkonia natronophila]RJN32397.1 response regulator [Nesterenkonia natronophila]
MIRTLFALSNLGVRLAGLDGIKTMIVDDERVIRRMISAKLSGLGCQVNEFADGQEALGALRKGARPDIILVDRLMPRLNGLELVRELRKSETDELAKLPIIMLTSRQGENEVIEGLEAGLDDYIAKPFSPDELAARVRTVLWRTTGRG